MDELHTVCRENRGWFIRYAAVKSRHSPRETASRAHCQRSLEDPTPGDGNLHGLTQNYPGDTREVHLCLPLPAI